MKMKTILLTGILALSVLCACGTSNTSSNQEGTALENSTATGNFSDPIFIENPGTDTVIVEMP